MHIIGSVSKGASTSPAATSCRHAAGLAATLDFFSSPGTPASIIPTKASLYMKTFYTSSGIPVGLADTVTRSPALAQVKSHFHFHRGIISHNALQAYRLYIRIGTYKHMGKYMLYHKYIEKHQECKMTSQFKSEPSRVFTSALVTSSRASSLTS